MTSQPMRRMAKKQAPPVVVATPHPKVRDEKMVRALGIAKDVRYLQSFVKRSEKLPRYSCTVRIHDTHEAGSVSNTSPVPAMCMFEKLVGGSNKKVYSAFEKLLERLEIEVHRVIEYELPSSMYEREYEARVVIQTRKKIPVKIVFQALQYDGEPELSFFWSTIQVGSDKIVSRGIEDEDRQIQDRRILETLLSPLPDNLPIQIEATAVHPRFFKSLNKRISFVVDFSDFEQAETNHLASVNKEFNKLFQTKSRERKEGQGWQSSSDSDSS